MKRVTYIIAVIAILAGCSDPKETPATKPGAKVVTSMKFVIEQPEESATSGRMQ